MFWRCEAPRRLLAIDNGSGRQYSSEVSTTTTAFCLYGQLDPTKLNFQAIKSLEFLGGQASAVDQDRATSQ